MSFFEKVKQGASGAAKKAQQTMETTKLRSQISGKEKEMERICTKIGQSIYEAYSNGDVSQSETTVMDYCGQLTDIQKDIDLIEEKIKNIKSEKTCSCGKVVAVDVNYCPDCGKRFPEEAPHEDTVGEIRVICTICNAENDINSKYCIQCGEEMIS
ncbi:zinc ribbon domain-containing protein [Paenibacillaceae bacterium]|nr:zinc ribbon domain-containing protein [Paenibacillaceae bacterium]